MSLKLEFYEAADSPALERLWQEETDWGGETLRQLREWFDEAPFGPPLIIVARDAESNDVVGECRFMPSRISADGREVRAFRPFGMIVSPRMRAAAESTSLLEQPAVAMYLRAVAELQGRGAQVVYIVPDPRWARMFKMFPFIQSGSFPLWSLPVPLDGGPLAIGEGFTAAPLREWDDGRVGELWGAARRLHGCMMVRDAKVLRWKLANANHTVTAVERGRELAGLVASRAKGERQWLVCDLLAADDGPALRATLAAVVNVAHAESLAREGTDAEEIRKVAVLATPVMEAALRALGFARDAYDFPLVVHVLDDSLRAEEFDPARWYVSAND